MFCSLLVFWLIVADPFLVTLISASLWELFATTENPCVMMRVNHITRSCEYIIIYHDELYMALTTLKEIIHIVNDKYKININPHVYQGSNFPYDPGGTLIC